MAYKNIEDRKEYMKQYQKKNHDYLKEYQKQWRKENPDYREKYSKGYRKNGNFKENIVQWQELHKKRLLQRKIGNRLRQRINKALVRQSSTKAKKTLFLLGCTIEEFIKRLEKQFTGGMKWAV